MSLVHFAAADGFNTTPVSEAAPLPVEPVDFAGDVNIAGDAIADFTAIEDGIGAPADAAYTTGDGSMISLLKAIHAQLVAINANTAPE